MMKRTILSLTVIATMLTTTQAQEVPQVANVLNRQTSSLNGDWHYLVDVQEEGYYNYRMKPFDSGFMLNAKPQKPEDLIEYDFDAAPTMRVPGDWNTQDERLFFYEGTVWLQRYFEVKSEELKVKSGRRTLLYFGAVNYDCHVYVNGKKAGHHIGGFTPFNYDVTDLLHEGRNFVVVKVDNKEAGHEVTLRIPELNIQQKLTTDANGSISFSLFTPNSSLKLWSPTNPKLYQVEIEMDGETLKDEIGFRTIETRGKQILLNGEPIFLKGISIHEEKPNGGGRANSVEDAKTLLTWAKELGCNYVRLAHYPHNEYMVREAERMGILVWSEIPCYWTIDWTNEDTYQNAQQQLHDMIARDHNRANIIIWSIANETPHSAERAD